MEKSRILIVDDEEIIRQLLKQTLERCGYDVEIAEDGNVALSKTRDNFFNLLITDLKMPKVDGIDVLKEIKTVNPYIEVIVITGFPTIESAVTAIKIGAFDFICKPFDVQEILYEIGKCLERQKFNINHVQLSELESLFEVSKTMAAKTSLDSLLNRVLDAALEITKSSRGSVLLFEEESKQLRIRAARGLPEEVVRDAAIRIDGSVTAKIIEEGKPVIVTNIEEDERFLRQNYPHYETKSFVGIPLRAISAKFSSETLGVINISDKISGENFTERELTLLSILSGQASAAIENIRLYTELQEKIHDLKGVIDKLDTTQSQLIQSEKLAALGRFSSGIAHEIKNPLGIILGGVEFVEIKLSKVNGDIKTAIEKIKESIARADTIVHGLLKFSRPSELKIEIANPEDLIHDTLSLLKYRAHLHNIRIETQSPEDTLSVEVDKNQIQQVLFNILINATEAMPNGGKITVKTYKGVSDNPFDKQSCSIEIADTGEGISKDNLSMVFEPFFTTKREKKGTGLGLSIAKMIVENHGGDLAIDSQENKGTQVKISLPLAHCKEVLR